LSEDDSNEVITTKEKFEEAKAFLLEDDCPMSKWDFIEGKHFIYFSY